jgi:DNA-binding SARP family transcriptional activator
MPHPPRRRGAAATTAAPAEARPSRAWLVPARPPRAPIPRAALVARAREALGGRLLRVVAGAGWGKTSLLALALDGWPDPVVWCACDARLGRGGLSDALALGLSRALGLDAPPAPAPGDDPEARAAALCDEIAARAPRDLVVVLDDVHRLLGTPAEAELAALARDLPPQVHLAVAGRGALPEPLGGPRPDAVDLDERALELSVEECAELLERLGAAPADAAERHREAEGWIAGVVLGARGGAAAGEPGEYLLREVVDALPEPAARLLEDTSVVDRFSARLAAGISGREDAGALIELLLARHAFVVPAEAGEGWYRQHRLLRAALARRVEAGSPRAAELHRRAARAWADAGEHEAAARHHLAAGDLSAAVTALRPLRDEDPARGPQLGDWLGAIPAGVWSDTSGLVLAQASQLFYRADYLGAFAAMESAVEALVAAGDHERAAVALVRLLRAVPLAGGLYERTIDVARALIPRIGPGAGLLPAARVMLALLLGESCRYAEAEDELESALEAGSGDPLTALHVNVTRAFAIDHPHGRRAPALAALDEAIPELERAHEADVLNYLVYARAFRAIVLSDVGRFADALEEADRVRDAAARRGLARLAAPVVAMLRFGPLAGLGHLDLLGEEIARSSPAFERLGGALRGYRHDVAAAALAAADGDPAGVARAVAAAREGLARHGMPYDAAMAHADLALAASAAGLDGEARELAGAARALAERASAPWAAVRAAMTAAIAWGPGKEGDAALAEALRRSSDHRLAALWSRRERRLAGELLPRALARGIEPTDTVLRLARACGAEVLAACVDGAPDAPVEARLSLAEVAASAVAAEVALDGLLKDPEPAVRKAARRAREARRKRAHESVRLITLGGFAVERDGRRIPDSEFGRQKARTLLALMACARGPVHREEVIETLWPELSKGRGLAALNSTLYALRRALEPHLSAGASSALIVASGATYRLVLGERDSWDAEEFLRLGAEALAADGEAGLRKLLEAEARYTGALLPEWAFAPWTEPLRTQLEELHRTLLVRVAEASAAAGRPAEAISRYRLLLAMEPEREGWHRALMRIYAGAGERALALRQYDACRTLLRESLGIEPSRETRELHTRLLRED